MSEINQSISLETLRGRMATEPVQAKRTRIVIFALLSILPVIFVWFTMKALAAVTLRDDTYSHIPLIPVISLFLIYLQRQRILARPSSAWKVGSTFAAIGIVCLALGNGNTWHWSMENALSMAMLGVVLTWTGSFALCFGDRALREARFPFLFLLFMVPLPEFVLHRTIVFLQQESSDASAFIFNVLGVPFLRQGFDFALPGIAIRVAEECSGIRSTLALLMMAVLVSHWSLRSFWKKVLLCLLVLPVAIFKNGLRIVTLSTLAVYVNPAFLYGNLHNNGGVVFFAAGLVPLALALGFLQRTEGASGSRTVSLLRMPKA
jgi:exosortase